MRLRPMAAAYSYFEGYLIPQKAQSLYHESCFDCRAFLKFGSLLVSFLIMSRIRRLYLEVPIMARLRKKIDKEGRLTPVG